MQDELHDISAGHADLHAVVECRAEAAPSRLDGAYLMAVIAGRESPSASDLKLILDAGGIAVDQEALDRVIEKMKGKQVQVQQLAAQARSALGGSICRTLRGSCL